MTTIRQSQLNVSDHLFRNVNSSVPCYDAIFNFAIHILLQAGVDSVIVWR